jgi:S-methylmethionine-dependent homocysteine/selenocysteine methylase
MSSYRTHLPQLDGRLFLTDGGLETTLVFHEGIDLPCFAAFGLLDRPGGEQVLHRYFERYVGIAIEQGRGIVLETPTWRANPDWGMRIGYDAKRLAEANRRSVTLVTSIRLALESPDTPIVISGNLGPRGDGYRADARMSPSEAYDYHRAQIDIFADSPADMVAAFTMTHSGEAVGIARAARAAGMPVAIAFTTETDGRLPSGETLAHAIEGTDHATAGYPSYYMINCAHPEHLAPALMQPGTWRGRVRGLRANASRRSHAELDESTDLDAGDPAQLAREYRELRDAFPDLAVVGGCCGTDERHVEAIGREMGAAVGDGRR